MALAAIKGDECVAELAKRCEDRPTGAGYRFLSFALDCHVLARYMHLANNYFDIWCALRRMFRLEEVIGAGRNMIETILDGFKDALGTDLVAYRNHCFRVAGLAHAYAAGAVLDPDKVAIAAAFHDLGIWTARTWDYLEPSIALATTYLAETGRAAWTTEITEAIERHHSVTAVSSASPLVEALRRADLADLSLGLLRSGLDRRHVAAVRRPYPNAGFHARLVQIGCAGALRHPLRPLPMMRW